ncbi:MAG: hypothetical protein QM758_28670 [Armatimonas sp.]
MNFKFKTLCVATCAALSLIATGCGGGGGTQVDETITRALIGGTGDSTTLTSKRWHMIFIRGNSYYVGTGADQPCPASIDHTNGDDSFDCDPNNALDFRSDGKARGVRDGVPDESFNTIWSLAGDTLTVIDRTEVETSQIVNTFKVTNEGIVGGHQRIRLNTISRTEEDGTTIRPDEAGFQIVFEEI